MSDLIKYDSNRKEISVMPQEKIGEALIALLEECYSIKGQGSNGGAELAAMAAQLAVFIQEKYTKYTIKELFYIVKNGYAFCGDEFVHVSVSNCLSIIKKYDENMYNREKLEEARRQPKEEIQGSPMSRAYDFAVENYRCFKNAKHLYEEGKVNDYKINFVFHRAYYHVLNEVDESINHTKEIRQEIWEDVKKYITECKYKELPNPKVYDTLMQLIFECKTESELADNALKGRLFHLWAINNF